MLDSAIFLHHGALHIPSTTCRAAGLARPYSSFRPSSLSLFSKASTYRTLSHHMFSSPVISAINKPSPPWPNYDKDNEDKIVRVMAGASVVLTCVIGVINCSYNFRPTAIAASIDSRPGSVDSRSGSIVLIKPQTVLDSMLTVNRHLAKPKGKLRKLFKSIPRLSFPHERPELEDRQRLKIAVADLIKSGMCDEAEKQLINLYDELKMKNWLEPAKEVDMELVLVLIFQGKYKEALKRDCLNDNFSTLSDGRVHFYKAIILTMLGEDDVAAEQCWNNFISSFNVTRGMDESDSEVSTPKKPKPLR